MLAQPVARFAADFDQAGKYRIADAVWIKVFELFYQELHFAVANRLVEIYRILLAVGYKSGAG